MPNESTTHESTAAGVAIVDSFVESMIGLQMPRDFVEVTLLHFGADPVVNRTVLFGAAQVWLGLGPEGEGVTPPREATRAELASTFAARHHPEQIVRSVRDRLTGDVDDDRLLLVDAATVILKDHVSKRAVSQAVEFWSEQ